MVNPTSKYRGKRGFSQGSGEETRQSGGKQEAQDIAKTVRPGVFVVDGSRRLKIGQIDTEAPSSLDQQALQQIRIAQMPGSLLTPHVEPDAKVGFGSLI